MYYFIVNPSSRTGKGKRLWDTLQAELDNRKIEYKVYFTKHSGDATMYAKQICEENNGTKRIVIVGGDGTSNEAINGLRDYDKIILGYIPAGSSNDLARGLKIPRDPIKALEAVINPKNFKFIDHGTLQCFDGASPRTFAVSCGMGYDAASCCDPHISKIKNILNKLKIGKLVYFLVGLKQVFVHKPAEATIILDGTHTLHYDRLIFIAHMNLPMEGGGLPMAPNADPTDGKLSCCIVHDLSRLRHLSLMPTIFRGNHIKHKGIDIIDCHTIEIKTSHPLMVHTDGEFAGKHDHVFLSCLPDKIKMML